MEIGYNVRVWDDTMSPRTISVATLLEAGRVLARASAAGFECDLFEVARPAERQEKLLDVWERLVERER